MVELVNSRWMHVAMAMAALTTGCAAGEADADEIDTSTAIYYRAALDVPNPDGTLRIGMTTEVTLVLAEAEGVLAVPGSAIRSTPEGGASVQVHDPATGETQDREVETGIASASVTEIRSGLEEGELVVTGRSGRPTRGCRPPRRARRGTPGTARGPDPCPCLAAWW